MSQTWNDLTVEDLDLLEKMRDRKRPTAGRLSFDCFNALSCGDRVGCKKFKRLGQANDASIALITVLRGRTSKSCKGCADFEGEKGEGE